MASKVFAELKRRNVFRAAAFYAATAWLLVQVATQVLPFFHIAESIVRWIVIAAVIGFPFAMVFSWFYEWTPHGFRREPQIAPDDSIARQTNRRFDRWIIAILGLAVVLLLADKFVPRDKAQSAASASERSIAVLPLQNLSPDPANAYFADGIQDEILTRLSKIAALKVISRSSTLKYKSAPENLREVGKQLGVAHLLEGSVQRIGNTVQINVQLIRAATDEHLWAESYKRKLDDAFAVEAEIASTIAEQLKAQLSGSEQKAIGDRPTQNTAAYDAYLRGISLDLSFVSVPRLQQATREYEEAVRLDPNFGIAWARLARARSTLRYLGTELELNTVAVIGHAAERAMALAPDAGETWWAQGGYRATSGEPKGAVAAYYEAQKRMPNNALIYLALGFGERRLGHWREAEMSLNKAVELDPRNVQVLGGASEFYGALRRFDEALVLADRAIAVAPEIESVRAAKATLLRQAGRLTEASEELKRIPADSTDRWTLGSRAEQATYERRPDDANRIAALISAFAPEQLGVREKGILIECAHCLRDAGRGEEAAPIFRRVLDETPADRGSSRMLALAYAGGGEKEKAFEAARRAIAEAGDLVLGRIEGEIALAMLQARLGEKETALAALPHLLEVPYGLTIADLKFNPAWDSLRDDSRFQKLCGDPGR